MALKVGFVAILWLFDLIEFAQCDVVCNSRYGYPVKYCYGVTAYCCGANYNTCCWQKIWKVWWFWVVAFVIITALLSCCGYYCSSSGEGRYNVLRRDSSFNVLQRFRRYSSRDYSPADESWKPPDDVALPPYTPSPSTSQGVGTSVDPNPAQNLPYMEPPPPYTTVVSHPQPTTEEENSSLLHPTTSETVTPSYNTSTVSSH